MGRKCGAGDSAAGENVVSWGHLVIRKCRQAIPVCHRYFLTRILGARACEEAARRVAAADGIRAQHHALFWYFPAAGKRAERDLQESCVVESRSGVTGAFGPDTGTEDGTRGSRPEADWNRTGQGKAATTIRRPLRNSLKWNCPEEMIHAQ